VPSLRINRKENKVGYIEAATDALGLIETYSVMPGHDDDMEGPLLGPIKNNTTKTLAKFLNPVAVDREIFQHNAPEYNADIAKVQVWLGHADISTTRTRGERQSSPEDNLTSTVRDQANVATIGVGFHE
jgi:integrase/recombinase XerD